MNPFWSKVVHQLAPYVPGEQPQIQNLVKLNTNECPYGPSPLVLDAIKAEASDALRLYPDPNAVRLKQAIAHEYGLHTEHVFVGNGSDEVLAHCFLGLLKHERPLVFPDVTYSFYPVYCGLYQVPFETVPLDSALRVRVEDYFERDVGAVIIANPNAPTGHALELSAIVRLLERKPGIVVAVDEAYVDFGAETAARLVRDYRNLLVIQTLSKSRSLAGLRVGFALGDPLLIEALERVKNCFNSYPLDRLAIAGATAAIQDRAYFEQTRAKVIRSRALLMEQLNALGFEVLPSKTNFVFARNPGCDAAVLAQGLRERGVIVRHFRQPRIEQFLRISVGTDEQCERLIAALHETLEANRAATD